MQIIKSILNSDFKEAEHPRDNSGRFTDKGNSVPSGQPVDGFVKSNPNDAITFKGSPFKIDLNDRKKTFDNFRSWYKENLQGKYVNNPILGKVIFTSSGMYETKHRNLSSIENLKYIVSIPEIIKTSKEIIKEQVKHTKQDIKYVYRIKGFINVNNHKRKVHIIVLEDLENKRYYTFDIRECLN